MITLNAAKAAVTPYLVWIKVGIFALCLAVSATLAYRYGTSTSRVEVAQLAAENASLRLANDSYAKAAQTSSELAEQAKEAGDQHQAQAEGIGQDVDKATLQIQKKKVADLEAANRALKDAKCQELMRMSVCPTVPLP